MPVFGLSKFIVLESVVRGQNDRSIWLVSERKLMECAREGQVQEYIHYRYVCFLGLNKTNELKFLIFLLSPFHPHKELEPGV